MDVRTLVLVSACGNFALLSIAMRNIPLGTAYAVWTGVGALGTAVIGIVYFKDPLTFARMFFLITLVASIIGLKAFSPSSH